MLTPNRSHFLRRMGVVLLTAGAVGLLLSLATTARAAEEVDPVLIDLARLSITHVSASSVNGDRELDNKYYGVLNLFDRGENFIRKINYTTWLTDAQVTHWVTLRFDSPVGVHAVIIETTSKRRPAEYAIECTQVHHDQRVLREFESVKLKSFKVVERFAEPLLGVDEIRIIFPGPGIIEVAEITVLGIPPQNTKWNSRQPEIYRVLIGEPDGIKYYTRSTVPQRQRRSGLPTPPTGGPYGDKGTPTPRRRWRCRR